MAPVARTWATTNGAERLARAAAIMRGEFRLLDHVESASAVRWDRVVHNRLWTYHLQYFEFGVDLAAAWCAIGDVRALEVFAHHAMAWIRAATNRSTVAWEPYAVATRAVNWSIVLMLAADALDASVRRAIVESLHAQLVHLEANVEWHLLGNHVQRDFHALAIGGLIFAGPRAEHWRRQAVPMLAEQYREQVLADGTHAERAPMYHALALADLLLWLELLRAAGQEQPAWAIDAAWRMTDAYGVLTYASGEPRLVNDSVHGEAPPRDVTNAAAHRVLGRNASRRTGVWSLPTAGYYGRDDVERGDQLFIDCGDVGPDHQPAHGHCDALSFELECGGYPIIVDSGVRGYDDDALRAYVRGTRAHNTVMIDGREQCEVWGTFRMARRGRVRYARHRLDGKRYRFEGGYSPYHALRSVHHRIIEHDVGMLCVEDRVEGSDAAPLASYIHLHPRFSVTQDRGHMIRATAGDADLVIACRGADAVRVVVGATSPAQGWYCPEFGIALAAPAIELCVNRNTGASFGYTVTVQRKA